jgi:hypothetical protein
MEENVVFFIGGFHENGRFYLHSWGDITDNWEDANDKLKKARLDGYGDYKIYKVKQSDFRVVEEDEVIKEFTILKDNYPLKTMSWLNEDLEYDCWINSYWKFNREKGIVCVQFEYSLYQYKMVGKSLENRNALVNQIEKDIQTQVMYRIMPEIKKVLKERNLKHIKVEFKSKYTGRKVIKGFVENKEA